MHLDGGPNEETTRYVIPRPGAMIVFPSYLIHSSDPNHTDVQRFSIALNTFPQGAINAGAWDNNMLTIGKVQGWDDLGPLNLAEYAK